MCQILIDGGAKVRMDPGATSPHCGYAARPIAPRRRNPVLLCPTCHRHALFAYQITQFDCCMSCYIHFSFLLLLEWKPSKTSPFLIFPDFSHSNSLFGQNWNSTIKIFHENGKTSGNFTCFFVRMTIWYIKQIKITQNEKATKAVAVKWISTQLWNSDGSQ